MHAVAGTEGHWAIKGVVGARLRKATSISAMGRPARFARGRTWLGSGAQRRRSPGRRTRAVAGGGGGGGGVRVAQQKRAHP